MEEVIDLDKILENNCITITIDIYKDDKVIYIAEECSSGSNYNYETIDDITEAITDYVKNNVEDKI